MKQNFKIKAITFILILFGVILFSTKVQAKSYKIENMDIQATVKENGNVYVKQTLKYYFDGDYNGIYIDIPNKVNDEEYDKYRVQSELKDSLYNSSRVIVNKVFIENTEATKTSYAYNGNKNVYTEETSNGLKRIKIYSPSSYVTKTFILQYTLSNLCVKHNDIGELYYNFIGGGWETEIEKLNIDIYLPNNTDINALKVFGHGPYNGKSKIASSTNVNFKVSNVKPGQYVAARVLFPKSNIINSTKNSNLNALSLIMQDENNIIENKEEKERFTTKVLVYAGILFVYWIVLLIIFEKDKKYDVTQINEEELFERYNPLLAGCIQESRTILSRDIIAVIVNLINKNVVKLNLVQSLSKENYVYELSKLKENEINMDVIEKYVYDWIFSYKVSRREINKDKINLVERLKELPKEEDANSKFKRLNDIAQDKLKSMGANKEMPVTLRIFNTILFAISMMVICMHIQFNGFNVYSSQKLGEGLGLILMYGATLLPFLAFIIWIPIRIIIMLRHGVNRLTKKITGKRLVTTTVTITLIFAVIIILTNIFMPNSFLIVDELLLGMSVILLLTDNLMLKNSDVMVQDFSRLNALKDKLENTLMDTRDIEYVTLWNEYLAYSISFGIADKIIEKLQGLHLDDDLMKLVDDSNFYDYISSDYYIFYTYASLDRKFLKGYENAISKIASSGGGYSSRRRRRIFRRWRWLFWRRRKRRRPEGHSRRRKF